MPFSPLRRVYFATLLVLVLCVESPSMAQDDPCEGPMLPPVSIDFNGAKERVELADVDNDGILEIIVLGGEGLNTGVFIFRHDGAGPYTRTYRPTTFSCPSDIGIADLNNDGFVDLCILMQCAHQVDIFLNDGTGGFIRSASPLETDRRPWDHIIDDIDGDGDMDIVLACLEGNSINVFRGDGMGTFGPAETQPTVTEPAFVELADYDRDGRQDLIVSGEDEFSAMLSLGDGRFAAPTVLLQGFRRAFFAGTIADINADGLWDIIGSIPGGVELFVQQPDGGFDWLYPIPGSAEYEQVAVADFDRNGHLDIVGMDRFVIEVLAGIGDLRFESWQHFVRHRGEAGLAAGDIDNDGDLDIVTIEDRLRTPLNLLYNQGKAWFVPFETVGPIASIDFAGATGIAAIDLDGDPFLDFVVAAQGIDGVGIYRNLGDGRRYARSAIGVGRRPRDIATGDLNGDGLEDMITANEISDDVSVLLNEPPGATFSVMSFPAGNAPFAVDLGDLDHDGDLDAVVAATSSNGIQVLLNDGSGGLTQTAAFSTGIRPIDVLLADVNGDGILDCLVPNEFQDDLSVLIGRGDGIFDSQMRFPAGDKPVSMAHGDVDGDGSLDAVIAVENDCSVVLMRGDGAGGFQLDWALPAGALPRGVQLMDLDGDRDLDLLVSSYELEGIFYFENDGTGRMTPISEASTFPEGVLGGDRPSVFAIEDFDGDGSPDIVSANGPDGSYSVMLNRLDQVCSADLDGDGELTLFDFLEFQNLFAAMNPRADFDGDGVFTIFDFLAFQNAFQDGCP